MKDPQVTAYINKQKSPQKEICQQLRKIIHATFPEIKEEIKNGVPWYGKYYLVALKDKVNMGFAVEGLTKKQSGHFEGKGKFMRHLKLYSLAEIDKKKIIRLLKMVEKNSRCSCL